MKKLIMFGALGAMMVSTANAGLLDSLFGKKDAEPQTLEEACNKDEITALCPEVILGTKTIQECLIENVSSVSKKCANYVKKAATEKVDTVKQKITDAKTAASEKTAEQQAAAAEQKAKTKAAKAELKKSLAETKAAAKALIDAEKAQIADSVSTEK
ncbi:MAG: hypothetical protein NC311_04180 [Muribaculaceae bacterium]|nr:hypothetical protein [Muribaculaceae bacterium]